MMSHILSMTILFVLQEEKPLTSILDIVHFVPICMFHVYESLEMSI